MTDTTDKKDKGPEIDTGCPKCGRGSAEFRYDEVHNEMALKCFSCGYRWCVPPMDRGKDAISKMIEMQQVVMSNLARTHAAMADSMVTHTNAVACPAVAPTETDRLRRISELSRKINSGISDDERKELATLIHKQSLAGINREWERNGLDPAFPAVPTDPVHVYHSHPEVRQHLFEAKTWLTHADKLRQAKKRGISDAIAHVLAEIEKAEVLL